jgi:ketol-acid reductoisomerase
MGMRVSRNLQKSAHTVFYSENSPAGQERIKAEGRDITATDDAVKGADVVILAVPDTVLGVVSEGVVPQMKAGAILKKQRALLREQRPFSCQDDSAEQQGPGAKVAAATPWS